jgi:hypothetical protein
MYTSVSRCGHLPHWPEQRATVATLTTRSHFGAILWYVGNLMVVNFLILVYIIAGC